MTYKKIIAPGGKQQRPTITSLGFKEGTELIILSIDDYKKLNLKDNKELLDKIDDQEETLQNLTNENKQLLQDIDEKEKTINNLIEEINHKNEELEANRINKTKLDETIKELDLLKETITDKVNYLVLSNENKAINLLTSLDNEYKQNIKKSSFWDRVLNKFALKVDLTKYTEELKQEYNKELENTKTSLLLTNEKLSNYNMAGLISPGNEE